MNTMENLYKKCIMDFNTTRDYNFKYCDCEINKCYRHRELLRDVYHTGKYINIWADAVVEYFVNNAEYEKYEAITNDLIERSSIDLEIYLREFYEKLFTVKSDYGHKRWFEGSSQKLRSRFKYRRMIDLVCMYNLIVSRKQDEC
ncbi:uncharacterized protein LOC126909097 [Daktulosphaira vitifoliae]|uniref:uncharacterized protein LOC126909087 n=1 Tax=Daktulosphaira vitifoliae TaxID=58002 RepID=UPI0021AAD44D|nr:uncharacterized protein LOC126909087 [Daktulosphaira vitifoliae]XP_050547439.1 uncharacterized protein LOC126909097 [Daktulosphaira vitifoliae]